MFVVLLDYVAPTEEIDRALPDHREWLTKHYEQGRFLASGPRDPRVGGVLITRSMDRAELDAILAADPFSVRGLARYEVIGFSPTMTAPELADEAVRP
ncbi:YciI family protein [Amycolatopsis sp. PS_44_ISF1]|uniref:YciI family protein n=1 Tax=Amycolatopsis sp. PS_44_ISF1 TaxID=2974917 RepID=UPI0028DFBDDC|nr:YciI family protein [Amycolatopsis sp. PS_44_ISF1]MDT8911522.1 YciI family protein [Amycolatopsis sp. PS_44_ISF1]